MFFLQKRSILSQKNNTIKILLVLLLAICSTWIAVLCSAPKLPRIKPIRPANDNEIFLSIQQKYEHHLEHTILKLLEPLVGFGKVHATVQVELNLKNARHNIQSYDAQVLPHTISKQTFDKEIQNQIQKQHISVIVDGRIHKENKGIYQPRTAQEMSTYKRLIQSAVGLDLTRGDTLEIQNMPFEFHPNKKHKLPLFFIAGTLVLFSFILILLAFTLCPHHAKESSDAINFSPDMLDKIVQNPSRAIAVIKNWIYMPANKKTTDWTPIQKVGIVLLALDEDTVRQILVAMDDNEVRQVAKTMTTLGVIPPQESARILSELHEAMVNGSAVVGNPTRVQQILSESTSEATLKFKETLQTPNSSLWQELARISPTLLTPRLVTLRPEITAFILYRFPTEKASEVLENFPESKATQVLIHLSHIGHISSNTSAKMEQEAINIAHDILNTIHTPTGTEKTSEIISQLSKTQNGQAVIKDLNEKEPFLAKKLTLKLIHFDDIAYWTDQNIQILLRHTLRATAITALINASDSVKKAIQRNMPKSFWTQLEKDIESKQKHVQNEEIQKARQEIVDNIKTLLTQGKIQI